MGNRVALGRQNQLEKFILHQMIEANLSSKLGIPDLRAGKVTIRDDRDWRINEKEIEYCWLINISSSLVGSCWLFSIKFKESSFREIKNQEELIQGLFTIDKEGRIEKLYIENQIKNFIDRIRGLTFYDMFDVNRGISLDGVGYEYVIHAPNSEIRISLNNPNSESWKTWENEVWKIARGLAEKAGIKELIEIFK